MITIFVLTDGIISCLAQGGGEKLPEALEEPAAAEEHASKKRRGGEKAAAKKAVEDKPKVKPSRSEQRRQQLKKGQKTMTLE